MKKLSKTAGKVAEQITEIILGLLQSKNLTPWACTWVGGGTSSRHKNYATSLTSFYDSWLNQMLLECAMHQHDFTSTEWITASELKKRKISFKGIPTTGKIVGWRDAYYKTHQPSGETEWANSKLVSQQSYHPAQELIQQGYVHVKLPKLYSLWNIDQFKELESRLPKQEDVKGTLNEDDIVKEAEAVIKNYKDKNTDLTVEILNSRRAFYSPREDKVVLPEIQQYDGVAEYYLTVFHELAHSTGHKDRLNRKGITHNDMFSGKTEYSYEELIAEMTACFMNGNLGLETNLKNSASYIKGWSKYLKDNPHAFFNASMDGRKAQNYILA